ncbi:protealysin inhibitor emfourin [Microbacterium immunditiarum]|uniref:Uncharacterized protein n=1 Tax=Microbacterium immunditiarum TaxID=337480 RepID=A0A7Y9GQR5_9MICO|nr:protealysin inhibitor emfourin [Microbacterium immunditiarum]NYE20942.1 hypothetical protein [Microbacterium immunditiarum]
MAHSPDRTGDDAPIAVIVVRTGGIAGLRREWRAEPPPDERGRWIELIEQCPWDEVTGNGRGADRFSWDVTARCADREHDATLADEEVEGPWRRLIDEVRELAGSSPPRAPRATTGRRNGPPTAV